MRQIKRTEVGPESPINARKPPSLSLPTSESSKGSCTCGGSCPRCAGKLLGVPVGSPDAAHEGDADRIAASRSAPVNSLIASGMDARQPPPVSALTAGDSAIGGVGRPLNAGELETYEKQLGADLSQVRVHDGSKANALANEASAEAFTIGRNVVVGDGAPGGTGNPDLMRHELAHVMQQGGAPALPGRTVPASTGPMMMRRVLRHATVNHLCGSSEPFLRSPPAGSFHLNTGETSITVTANLHWDRPANCGEDGEFFITLVRDIDFWFDSDKGNRTFPIGSSTSHTWSGLTDDANYYLEIRSNNTNPGCCIVGSIDIDTP